MYSFNRAEEQVTACESYALDLAVAQFGEP